MVSLKDMLGGDGLPDTFLGLPRGEDFSDGGDIVIFGADCATPYASVGAYCAGGPAAVRAGSADYAGRLDRVNFDLGAPILPGGIRAVDAGDVPTDPAEPVQNRARIRSAAEAILEAGGVPVLLGGDDSVPTPMLEAFAGHGPITILQIDAHIDWRDEVQGERWGLSSTMRRASEMDHVERIIQVGARGVGSAGMDTLEAAQDWGAHIIPAHELPLGGAERAIDLIPQGGNLVICLDWDALDPSIMPAVIAPTGAGMSHAQTLALLGAAAQRARIVGVDAVEFMPANDVGGTGARTAAQVLTTLIGLIGQQCAAQS